MRWNSEAGNDRGSGLWNDGSLPLTLRAALGIEPEQCALSNAVLWSVVTAGGTNETPPIDLRRASATVWRELLAALRPRLIVTVGGRAHEVVGHSQKTELDRFPILRLMHPCSRNQHLFKKQLAGRDPLHAFPEVEAAARHHRDALQKYHDLKLAFAVHAVEATRHLKAT